MFKNKISKIQGAPASLLTGVMINLLLCLLFLCQTSAMARPYSSSRQPEDSASSLLKSSEAATLLSPGRLIDRELSGGAMHAYEIDLLSGRFLQIVVLQQGIDIALELIGPDGSLLIIIDTPNGAVGPEQLCYIAEMAGRHRLLVRARQQGVRPGHYQLKVAAVREPSPQDRGSVDALKAFKQGERLFEQETSDSLRAALAQYETALELYRSINDRFGQGYTLHSMSKALLEMGETHKALDLFNQSLTIKQEVGDLCGQGYTLDQLGRIYYTLGDSVKALAYYSQALKIFREVGERRHEMIILSNFGRVYDTLGEKEKALDYYNQALELRPAAGDQFDDAYTFTNIGKVYDSIGEKQKALEYLEQGMKLRRAAGDRYGEAYALTHIGVVYDSLGEKQKALDCFLQSLTIRDKIGDRYGKGYSLNNVGRVYDTLGEKQKALDYYEQALEIRRYVGDRRGEAITLNNIGGVYSDLGEDRKALDYFNLSLALRKAVGDRNGEAQTLNNIGRVFAALGARASALDCFHQALALRRSVGDRQGEAATLFNIGKIYADLSEYEKSRDYYNRALLLNRAVGDRAGEINTLYGIAAVEKGRGKLAEARTSIEEALTIIESLRTKVNSPELRSSYFATVQNYYELYIDLLMQLHRLHPSEGLERAAFQASERARARILLESLTEMRADIRQGISPALVEQERVLRQQLNAKADYQVRLLNGQHTKEQLAAVQKEIEGLIEQLWKTEAQIRKENPRFAALSFPQPLNLKELQEAVLDADTLLLEYTLGNERSYLWAVTETSITGYELAKREDIEKAAQQFYELITARAERRRFETDEKWLARIKKADAKLPAVAANLSRMLLAPVAERLERKRLLIVADGLLQYLPFAALPIPAANRVRYAPLITEHEIVNLPSASTLALQRRELSGRESAPKTMAIFANPVFSPADSRTRAIAKQPQKEPGRSQSEEGDVLLAGLTPLPETEVMARKILSLITTRESKLVTGFEANLRTATSPELGQYKIIQFTTHGFLNPNPELSGIVLSLIDEEGREQNGFLSAAAIYNLKLNADLVVLTACRTGLDFDPLTSDKVDQFLIKKIRDQGFTGLTRGFVYAGAERVMVSLWNIRAKATSELMVRFYKGMMGAQRLSPAAALRAAQIQMWRQKRWNSPYYWAAFTVSGEYNR